MRRAPGSDPALEVDQVLEHHRYAVERADGVAGADHPVGALGGEPRIVGEDRDEGLQLRLQPRDAVEMGLHGRDRRDRAGGDGSGEGEGGQRGGIGHGCLSERFTGR